jgi:hypothetical protein
VIRAPWDGDKLHAWALANYPSAADPNDDEFSDLRLVLADLFWTYGIEHPPTIESAQRIIADGSDLAAKRAFGMGERDLRKRANVLDGLADKLRTDNPKPRARRILTKPERFVLEVGDCLLYPTSQGHIRNPYVGPRMEERFFAAHRWEADGWGAALVLMRYYRYGVFARYVIAVLRNNPDAKPRLANFAKLSIRHSVRIGWRASELERRVHAVETSSQHLKRMRVEIVGSLVVDRERVEAEFTPGEPPITVESNFANKARIDRPGNEDPRVEDPIAAYLT